jgi:tripartite ATP-independent transporter DctM subunit
MNEALLSCIVVGSLILVLFTGIPIVFGLTGLSAILITILFGPQSLFMIVAAVSNQMSVDVFLAIPMFVLMAIFFQNSGAASSLYHAMYVWMGGLRGGLAAGTVGITAMIAAMSGVGATGTITMGLFALPELLKRKYNRLMSIGCITAGGALGPIIPPSILMIIIGGYTQLSVGKLFIAGIIPGLIIAAAFAAYIFLRCLIRVGDGPPIEAASRGDLIAKIKALRHLIMPILLIVVVLGFIYAGIGTPTEAASMGAFGAFIIGLINRKLTLAGILESLQMTTRVTCMVMWLIFGGACYSTLVNVSGIGGLISEALTAVPFGDFGLLGAMLLVALFLGMFIDPVAICMITLPIFMPAIRVSGLDPLWSVVMFAIAVVTGYITPPFGVNLFFMKGVAPGDVTMREIYRGTLPYVLIKVACIILFVVYPGLILYLPNMLK